MAKPQTKTTRTFDNTNKGTLNVSKDPVTKEPTDRVFGQLDIAGKQYRLNGTLSFDKKNQSTINFAVAESLATAFGTAKVVSEDGVLKGNGRQTTAKSPAMRGQFSIGQQGYRLSAWLQKSPRTGDFLSLSVQTEEEYQAYVAEAKAAGGETPAPAQADAPDPLAQ